MPATSTQQFIPIAQIKRGVLILKNGGLRAILKVTPVNFALKSQQDQEVLTGQFQNFLNSLEFPLQMTVQSRKLDVFPYLKGLADYAQNISSDLLRLHAFDYIGFVQKLTDLANIMNKKFFCVVPYEARPLDNPSMLKKLFSAQLKVSLNLSQFNRYKKELEQRVQVVAGGLESIGLQVKQLSSQEIVEEFYDIFNPEEAHEERLQSLGKINLPIIRAQKPAVKKPLPSQEIKKPVDNTAHKLNPPSPPSPQNPPKAPNPPKPPSSQKAQNAPNPPKPEVSRQQPEPQQPDRQPSLPPQQSPGIDPQIEQDAKNILKKLKS